MKKVLIIDDEYEQIRAVFEYDNAVYMNNELHITKVEKAQQVRFEDLPSYNYIFLDIPLAKGSSMDGFGILSKIEKNKIAINKLIILTGNSKKEERMKSKGIKGKYSVTTKPIDFIDLKDALK